MTLCDCKKIDHKHKKNGSYNMHWSFGNGKLAKEGIVSFNLPAFKSKDGFNVCPMASTCALVCYALQGRYVMANVQTPREHNLAYLRACEESQDYTDFVKRVTSDLNKMHHSWVRVRIHDSGDFFSDNYFFAWIAIAYFNPHKEFYAYTKRVTLLNAHRAMLPKNLHIVQSVGGKEDSLIDKSHAHAVIFPDHKSLEKAGYVDASESDKPAYNRVQKIGLVYHGTTKLSTNNKQILHKKSEAVFAIL